MIEMPLTGAVASLMRVPAEIFTREIGGLYGSTLFSEIPELINYYDIYENGVEFETEGSKGDYIPSDLRYKSAASIIDKEARFMFSKPPEYWVDVPYDKSNKEQMLKAGNQLQVLVNKVLAYNNFNSILLKAAKDCLIAKRVAYFVNFDEEKGSVRISFIPSLEFVYDTDESDPNLLTKIIAFYNVTDYRETRNQRIYKKKYWLQDGVCWINEGLYDGMGKLVEELIPDRPTKFTYIPAGVIVNDGLTGDLLGVSELDKLSHFEKWYSRMANADMDAERQGMNPVRYARDMNPGSTKNLSIGAGSFWDLVTDPAAPEGVTGEVGVLETSMGYTSALASTLGRIKSGMFETVDMPDVSPEALKGVVSSGKTLEAIYWGLIVRCEEKMLAWKPALKRILEIIIEGAKLYPGSVREIVEGNIPNVEYTVRVDNQYPLPGDEATEKQTDLSEVNFQTMSKKAYMKKWRNLTDDEADAELKQIALELSLMEGGSMPSEGEDPEEGGEEGEEDIFADFEDEEDDFDDEEPDPEEDELLKILDELEAQL